MLQPRQHHGYSRARRDAGQEQKQHSGRVRPARPEPGLPGPARAGPHRGPLGQPDRRIAKFQAAEPRVTMIVQRTRPEDPGRPQPGRPHRAAPAAVARIDGHTLSARLPADRDRGVRPTSAASISSNSSRRYVYVVTGSVRARRPIWWRPTTAWETRWRRCPAACPRLSRNPGCSTIRPDSAESHCDLGNRGGDPRHIPGRSVREHNCVASPISRCARQPGEDALALIPGRLREALAEYQSALRIRRDPEVRQTIKDLRAGLQ